jgi:hypothetical protein
LQIPPQNPEVQVRIAGSTGRNQASGRMENQRPGECDGDDEKQSRSARAAANGRSRAVVSACRTPRAM